MRITQEADYALRLMNSLAKRDEKTDAKTISEESAVPIRFSLKILRKLVNRGLVKSFKGVSGGYALAKTPAEITLLSIVETIEGSFEISRCLGDEYDCGRVGNKDECPFHCIFRKINAVISDKLGNITLAMILDEGCDVIKNL